MKFAEQGHLPKHVLVNLLSIDQRQPYLKACADRTTVYRGVHG
jgi:hypothetical protein